MFLSYEKSIPNIRLPYERVIDEETGSFETLPDGAPTGVNPLLFEPQPQKTFENGMLRIRKNGNTYNVNGTKVD